MKVYFTHSTRNTANYEDYYTTIKSVIEQLNHELIYHSPVKIDTSVEIKMSTQYSKIMRGIQEADICIFDTSSQSMRIGHQVTFAVENRKPTLMLAHQSAGEVENFFISGSKSGNLALHTYNSHFDLKTIIPKFIERNKTSKVRLNLALEKYLMDFVKAQSYEREVTQTDIIRLALENLIQQVKMNS